MSTEEKNTNQTAQEETSEKQETDKLVEEPSETELSEETTAEESAEENTEEAKKEPGEVDLLKKEIAKLNDTILRDRAEFQNYRKRSGQEAMLSEGRTAGKILQEILPAFDSFDQLITSASSSETTLEKFLEGAALIKKQLWQVFENLGVEEVSPEEKQDFDPQLMEALSVQEAEDVSSEIVAQVYQKGYKFKERILRPARVAVKKPKG